MATLRLECYTGARALTHLQAGRFDDRMLHRSWTVEKMSATLQADALPLAVAPNLRWRAKLQNKRTQSNSRRVCRTKHGGPDEFYGWRRKRETCRAARPARLSD